MSLADYLPVLIQILIVIGIGAGILVASHIFGQRAAKGSGAAKRPRRTSGQSHAECLAALAQIREARANHL